MSQKKDQAQLQEEFHYLTSLIDAHKKNYHGGPQKTRSWQSWRKPVEGNQQYLSTQYSYKSHQHIGKAKHAPGNQHYSSKAYLHVPRQATAKSRSVDSAGYHSAVEHKNKYSLVKKSQVKDVTSKAKKVEGPASGSANHKGNMQPTTASSSTMLQDTRSALAKQFVLNQLKHERVTTDTQKSREGVKNVVSHPVQVPHYQPKPKSECHVIPSVKTCDLVKTRIGAGNQTSHSSSYQLSAKKGRVHINPKLFDQIKAHGSVSSDKSEVISIQQRVHRSAPPINISQTSSGQSQGNLHQGNEKLSRNRRKGLALNPDLYSSSCQSEVSSIANKKDTNCLVEASAKSCVAGISSDSSLTVQKRTVQNNRYRLIKTGCSQSQDTAVTLAKSVLKNSPKSIPLGARPKKSLVQSTKTLSKESAVHTRTSNLSQCSDLGIIHPLKSGTVSSVKPRSSVNKRHKWVRASPVPLKASTPIQALQLARHIQSISKQRTKTPQLVSKGKYKLVKLKANQSASRQRSQYRLSVKNKATNNPHIVQNSKYKFVKKSGIGKKSCSPQVTPSTYKYNKQAVFKTMRDLPHRQQSPQLVAVNKYKMVRPPAKTPLSLQTSWKLQTKYKLIRKALLTNQKKVRKQLVGGKPVSLGGQNSARKSTWKLDRRGGAVREQRQTRNSSKHDTKTQWQSRYSLKKSSPISGSPVLVNQVLCRSVSNASRSPFKFIRSSERSASKASTTARTRLKLDRRPSKLVSPKQKYRVRSGQKVVRIGGVLYKSSHTSLAKTGHTVRPSRSLSNQRALRKNLSRRMRTVVVRGARFTVTSGGKTLRRLVSKDSKSRSRQTKRVDIGGVTYIQTKPGTLVRAATSIKRVLASRSLQKSIVTATRFKKSNLPRKYCMFYSRFGKCNRGDKCPYTHDPNRVAICTRFLRGRCRVTDCPFSHAVSKEKMPVCHFFLRGVCNKDDCPYLHVNVRPDAEVCQDFVKGYCALGEKCKKKHSLVCQQYAETGSCPRGRQCPLQHRSRSAQRSKSSTGSVARNLTSTSALNQLEITPERASEETEVKEEWKDDSDLPLSQRHLPAYISLDSGICKASNSADGVSNQDAGKPLQIRPRLLSSSQSVHKE